MEIIRLIDVTYLQHGVLELLCIFYFTIYFGRCRCFLLMGILFRLNIAAAGQCQVLGKGVLELSVLLLNKCGIF